MSEKSITTIIEVSAKYVSVESDARLNAHPKQPGEGEEAYLRRMIKSTKDEISRLRCVPAEVLSSNMRAERDNRLMDYDIELREFLLRLDRFMGAWE